MLCMRKMQPLSPAKNSQKIPAVNILRSFMEAHKTYLLKIRVAIEIVITRWYELSIQWDLIKKHRPTPGEQS